MSASDEGATEDAPAVRRLDKWLWFARVAKSRTMAAGLIEGGKARLNRSKVAKPSQGVRVGDVLTMAVGPRVRILKILALGERRGPPPEARSLYEDLTPADIVAQSSAAPAQAARLPGSGRPTKRDRRQVERFKGG